MPPYVAYILAIITAIAGTVVAFILIVPDKKRDGLNKFFKILHDIFNFKQLLIEKILKALYIFSTIYVIVLGVFYLITVQPGYSRSFYMGGYGLLLIVLGPIVVRVVYEALMLGVLLVKNAIEINNKMNPQPGSVADKTEKEKEQNFASVVNNNQTFPVNNDFNNFPPQS